MKVKLTLILVQYNKYLKYDDDNHTKIFFTGKKKLPHALVSTKDEKETLKELCEKHFRLSFEWMEKRLQDFRIINNNGDITAEAVYIIHTPEVVGSSRNGSFLTFSKIKELNIKLDEFYERAITGTGRPVLR